MVTHTMQKSKIFLSGPITKDPNYMEHFAKAEEYCKNKFDCVVLNPTIYPKGLTNAEYMKLGFNMLEISDIVLMLDGWSTSKGANLEYEYAKYLGKLIYQEGNFCAYDSRRAV